MKIPKTITVSRETTYNIDECGAWVEDEKNLNEVIDMVLDWAVEDLSHSSLRIHMKDENGNEIPWEDIINQKEKI